MLPTSLHAAARPRRFLRLLGAGLALAVPLSLPADVLGATPIPTPTRTPLATAAPMPSPAATSVPAPTPVPTVTPVLAPATAPNWLQALRPIALWSGPDADAVQLGIAERWDYFELARPQQDPRLLVIVARTKNYAWVDALAVGPSGPPPPGWPPADLPPPPEDLSLGWVATVVDAPLWADPDGTLLLGQVPFGTAFKQLEPQSGPRLRVEDPYSGAASFVDAVNVGPVPGPENVEAPGRWWGVVAVDGANVRPSPSTRETAIGQLPAGTPVVVSAWVEGEEVVHDNPTWAQLGDGTYLHSSVFRPVALPSEPPPPVEGLYEAGRWIDLNLTLQIVTAYEGVQPVYVARTSTGRPGWDTQPGVYHIQRRVENETMDSSTLVGLDAQRAEYKVENIRWTQYFTGDGKALHENYWKPRDQFGIPSSHGCAGLVAEDAQFFWDWASIGTPIYAHV